MALSNSLSHGAWIACALGLVCCSNGSEATSSTSGSTHAASSSATAGVGGAGATSTTASSGSATSGQGGAGGAIDKAANCTGTFGTALTNAFGRLDGTVLAVVKPSDTQCPFPNNDHVVLEVTMNGDAYRLVINVQSTVGDPKVQYIALDHALPAPVWADGWHTGLHLDYIADFGVHGNVFTPYTLTDLSDTIANAITIGQKVSVYSQSTGGDSAHEIHRNDGLIDGAIVLDPDTAKPVALLFKFADQTF